MTENNIFREIKGIRKALENSKLVIFVGAGVSANSNLPTWTSLIEKMAQKIEYRPFIEHTRDEEYKFSSDEYIKIPQFFFDNDKERYYQVIDDSLNVSVKPNSLHNLIIKLLPNHIITTNYDQLLENSTDLNVSQYTTITSDKDLLTKSGEHYIIKMHGDINDVENIVLKENDYLNYTNNHILIETFIKSLLADHTFLFVGYSLSDYNFKQIMSWIDYISQKESIPKENRRKHFIVQNSAPKEYEINYWESKALTIIDSSEIRTDLVEKYKKNDLTRSVAQELNAFLEMVSDEKADLELVDFEEYLLDKYTIFKKVNKIYIYDFTNASYIKNYIYGEFCLYFLEERDFEKWAVLAQNSIISMYMQRAGIYRIAYIHSKLEPIDIERGETTIENIYSQIVSFNYRLADTLNSKTKKNDIHFYFQYVIGTKQQTIDDFYLNGNQEVSKITSKWEILINKYNRYIAYKLCHDDEKMLEARRELRRFVDMLSVNERARYNYLTALIDYGIDKNSEIKAIRLYKKIEEKYSNGTKMIGGTMLREFTDLRSITLQHFQFLRMNGILLDEFKETKDFFECYINAMLITYKLQKNDTSGLGEFGNPPAVYKLEKIDINIFVMFARYKDIRSFCRKENIHGVLFEDNLEILTLFKNFCESILYTLKSNNRSLLNKLSNFSLLLRHADLSEINTMDIYDCVVVLLKNKYFQQELSKNDELSAEVLLLLKYLTSYDANIKDECFTLILNNLNNDIRRNYIFNDFIRYISKKSNFSSSKRIQIAISKVIKRAESEREISGLLGTLFPIMSDYMKRKYRRFLEKNIETLDVHTLIDLANDREICINNNFIEQHLVKLEKVQSTRVVGFTTFPNPIEVIIEKFLLLHFFGKIKNIDFLKEFSNLSVYLEFIFNYRNFDYSKLDVNDPMWINFFIHKNYREILLKYGRNQLKKEISNNIEQGVASEEQKKVFYRFLIDNDEFWKY